MKITINIIGVFRTNCRHNFFIKVFNYNHQEYEIALHQNKREKKIEWSMWVVVVDLVFSLKLQAIFLCRKHIEWYIYFYKFGLVSKMFFNSWFCLPSRRFLDTFSNRSFCPLSTDVTSIVLVHQIICWFLSDIFEPNKFVHCFSIHIAWTFKIWTSENIDSSILNSEHCSGQWSLLQWLFSTWPWIY